MKHSRGFTLIEVMIVVTILALLSSIAVPSYTRYVKRSHRADAKTALMAVSQRMEQNYSLAGVYNATQDGTAINTASLTTWGMNNAPSSTDVRYTIEFASISATGYVVQATPAGGQTGDTCGIYKLNERNLKAAKGDDPNAAGISRSANTQECWNK